MVPVTTDLYEIRSGGRAELKPTHLQRDARP
jgi:hypothetical protein